MNANNLEITQTQEQQPKKKKVLLWGVTGIFIIALLGSVVYWYFILRLQEYTDDAYVVGLQVPIMAQTSGNVTQIFFEDTDLVHAGDVIVSLDDTTAKIAVAEAKHALASAVRQVQVLYQNNIGYQAAIEEQQIALTKAKRDYARLTKLGPSGAVSQEVLQHGQEAVQSAQSALTVAVQKLKSNQALLLNTTVDKQPAILSAAESLRKAWVNLQYTKIKSPVTGYVARRSVQIGSQVSPNSDLMVIVPITPMWINANFKETQLNNIRIGQSVKVITSIYGSNKSYDGVVTGIGMGTGAAFSLLPAQNATGNWIKIVQRLPVRIDLNADQLIKNPLRIGLSSNVTVDVADQKGNMLAATQRIKPAFESLATVPDLDDVNIMINQIIQQNMATQNNSI